MKPKFEVGQTVWERNPRCYGDSADKHFQARTILGIEKQSYLVSYPGSSTICAFKVSIRRYDKIAWTDAEKTKKVWVGTHRRPLSEAVASCNSVDVLRQIAALVGYDTEADQ